VARQLSPAEELLERYRGWLLDERGVAASSARLYLRAIGPFVAARENGEGLDWVGLGAEDVSGFLIEAAGGDRVGKAKTTATALRSLLGFLHHEGLVGPSLAGAVPSVASWTLAALPRTLQADEVARLLASCDRRTTLGRRAVAMLLLLARLGLRAAEVAGLDLDDIDWRAGELQVAGKGARPEQLPMPDDVGRAVVGYLQRGRPATPQDRAVFVRVKAPHRRQTSEAVSGRTLHTGAGRLTDKQKDRLTDLSPATSPCTWRRPGGSTSMIAADRGTDRVKGRELMAKLIESVSHGAQPRWPNSSPSGGR